MPQTLTKEWEQKLSKNAVEIHNNYNNDIGNLWKIILQIKMHLTSLCMVM